MVVSFLLGCDLIETFDLSFFKTCYSSESVKHLTTELLQSLLKATGNKIMKKKGQKKSVYQSQWKYKVLIMLNEEIWAFGYFCGSELF